MSEHELTDADAERIGEAYFGDGNRSGKEAADVRERRKMGRDFYAAFQEWRAIVYETPQQPPIPVHDANGQPLAGCQCGNCKPAPYRSRPELVAEGARKQQEQGQQPRVGKAGQVWRYKHRDGGHTDYRLARFVRFGDNGHERWEVANPDGSPLILPTSVLLDEYASMLSEAPGRLNPADVMQAVFGEASEWQPTKAQLDAINRADDAKKWSRTDAPAQPEPVAEKHGQPGDVWLYRVGTVGGGCEHELVSKSDELCHGNESWLTKQGCIQLDEHATLIRRASPAPEAHGFEVTEELVEEFARVECEMVCGEENCKTPWEHAPDTYRNSRRRITHDLLTTLRDRWSPQLDALRRERDEARGAAALARERLAERQDMLDREALQVKRLRAQHAQAEADLHDARTDLAAARREAEEARAAMHEVNAKLNDCIAHAVTAEHERDAARAEVEKLKRDLDVWRKQEQRLANALYEQTIAARPATLSGEERERLRTVIAVAWATNKTADEATDIVLAAALAVAERRIGGEKAAAALARLGAIGEDAELALTQLNVLSQTAGPQLGGVAMKLLKIRDLARAPFVPAPAVDEKRGEECDPATLLGAVLDWIDRHPDDPTPPQVLLSECIAAVRDHDAKGRL